MPAAAPAPGALMRRIVACHSPFVPGRFLPVRLGAAAVGWARPALVPALARLDPATSAAGAIALPEAPERLEALTRAMAEVGLMRWRGEAFDVLATPDGPALSRIDRGALPVFGLLARGAHLNGLVRRPEGVFLWVARRAAHRALDPGKLDHLAAGGVAAGYSPHETLVKEAGEEAAIPPELAARAQPRARLAYSMERHEGLRRDLIHGFDLDLPEEFAPHAADGEAESFALWPLAQALARVRETEDFKFNVALVLIDLGLREGLIPPASAEAQTLRTALDAPGW